MEPHDLLRQVWPAALMYRTRKYPTLWRLVPTLTVPVPQCLNEIIVSGDGFLGTFRLADANDVLNDRACDVDLVCLKVDVLPFQSEDLASSQTCSNG